MCIHGDKSQPEREWVLKGNTFVNYMVFFIFFIVATFIDNFIFILHPLKEESTRKYSNKNTNVILNIKFVNFLFLYLQSSEVENLQF